MLPPDFIKRILTRNAHSGQQLLHALNEGRVAGLRTNGLKITPSALRDLLPFELETVPWCADGFYYKPIDKLGLHPLHFAGLYYIQEPSAMYTVEALGVLPGHKVLDLCAAPGGKSTQVLAKLKSQGILIANEINPARAKTLAFNLERFGAYNFVVTNSDSATLAGLLTGYFDRIIVDAPCSGEGMFRKEPETRGAWQAGHPAGCALRQKEILSHAIAMLRPGGIMVYSTCTFAEEENEWQIARLLSDYPELEAVLPPAYPGVEILSTPPSARLLPHLLAGEGHYCAVLRKIGGEAFAQGRDFVPKTPQTDALRAWQSFADGVQPTGALHMWEDNLFLMPQIPALTGVRIERTGLKLGSIVKGRFEPDHALALSLLSLPLPRLNFAADSAEITAYLQGHVLDCDLSLKGWMLVCCEGYPVGLGKASNGQVKNHFPKGLRLR